jgi:hypothetical protein
MTTPHVLAAQAGRAAGGAGKRRCGEAVVLVAGAGSGGGAFAVGLGYENVTALVGSVFSGWLPRDQAATREARWAGISSETPGTAGML